MAKLNIRNGLTSIVLRVKILDTTSTTGAGKTGLTFSSGGLIISTIADNEATATAYAAATSGVETITTLGTFAAPTGGKCRFKEVDGTNHPGLYEIQIADARWAVSNARSVIVTIQVTGGAQVDAEVQQIESPADVGPAGLDRVTVTEPSARPTTFPGFVIWLFMRFANAATRSTTAIVVKKTGGATCTTQTISDDGAGNEAQGST